MSLTVSEEEEQRKHVETGDSFENLEVSRTTRLLFNESNHSEVVNDERTGVRRREIHKGQVTRDNSRSVVGLPRYPS